MHYHSTTPSLPCLLPLPLHFSPHYSFITTLPASNTTPPLLHYTACFHFPPTTLPASTTTLLPSLLLLHYPACLHFTTLSASTTLPLPCLPPSPIPPSLPCLHHQSTTLLASTTSPLPSHYTCLLPPPPPLHFPPTTLSASISNPPQLPLLASIKA
ncbi:hypothetical protein Pcinc_043585 [Petrolisthes cinctipes]|uniref:Uncharacterized protein n=1 Tax=Petrolisthes cinctipes TaxID=88211 RepID=A0AAE1BGB9_PETCI|nr:hypothetical protein Pcinc_043585 [Petrolisthes cinctipes]